MESIFAIQLIIEFASGCLDVDHLKHREFLNGMTSVETIAS